MRRLIMLLTVAASFLTISAMASEPPQCDPNCPWDEIVIGHPHVVAQNPHVVALPIHQ